jgi:hypothetical protein
MKNVLMAISGLFILGGTLGFRPVAALTTLSEESIAEHSSDARSLPGLRPSPAYTSKEVRFSGVIQSINVKSSAINVGGTWVHVSSETMISATVAMVMGIEDLVVGTRVQVYGALNKEGSITARRIDLLANQGS